MIWGVHISLAPTWFDPAETPGVITPFMVMYALHDAMLKPMPDNALAPSLAESWSASEDGLSYDFVLRKGAKFHTGEAVTAEDVKFSFERYRGTSHDMMKERVAAVETPDAEHVRFRLKKPWPDFVTFTEGRPVRPGSSRRNMSRRSARRASKRRRSAPAPTNSSRSTPVWS